MKTVLSLVLGLLWLTAAAESAVPACASDPAPRAAVENFMRAMKARKFEEAYQYVTATMTDGRPVAEWAALQQKMFDLGGVSIGKIDVREARRAVLADGTCATEARVPNVLRAEDVLNTGGSTEFEVYTVLLQEGAWKIDSQETLFEPDRIREWFPEDEIPSFGDTRRGPVPSWIRIPRDLQFEPDRHAETAGNLP